MNVTSEFNVVIELGLLYLELNGIAVVYGEANLLGEGFDELEIGFGKGESVSGVGHSENSDQFALKKYRRDDERAHLKCGIVVLNDARVVLCVGNQ